MNEWKCRHIVERLTFGVKCGIIGIRRGEEEKIRGRGWDGDFINEGAKAP